MGNMPFYPKTDPTKSGTGDGRDEEPTNMDQASFDEGHSSESSEEELRRKARSLHKRKARPARNESDSDSNTDRSSSISDDQDESDKNPSSEDSPPTSGSERQKRSSRERSSDSSDERTKSRRRHKKKPPRKRRDSSTPHGNRRHSRSRSRSLSRSRSRSRSRSHSPKPKRGRKQHRVSRSPLRSRSRSRSTSHSSSPSRSHSSSPEKKRRTRSKSRSPKLHKRKKHIRERSPKHRYRRNSYSRRHRSSSRTPSPPSRRRRRSYSRSPSPSRPHSPSSHVTTPPTPPDASTAPPASSNPLLGMNTVTLLEKQRLLEERIQQQLNRQRELEIQRKNAEDKLREEKAGHEGSGGLKRETEDIERDNVERRKRVALLKEEKERKQNGIDLCFIMDCTNSMTVWIKEAKENIEKIAAHVQEKYGRKTELRMAFVAYRDFSDNEERLRVHTFSQDVDNLRTFVSGLEAKGGGDDPEDLAGALDAALKLDWSLGTRLIILFTDAPCHGTKYHEFKAESYPDGDPTGLDPERLLAEIAAKDIDFYFGEIHPKATRKMTDIFKKAWEETGTKNEFAVVEMGRKHTDFLPKVLESIFRSRQRTETELHDLVRARNAGTPRPAAAE